VLVYKEVKIFLQIRIFVLNYYQNLSKRPRFSDAECLIQTAGNWVRSTPVRNVDFQERLLSYDVLLQDITEHKQILESLSKSETKYRTLVENIVQKVFLKDRDSVYISCSESYAETLEIKPSDIAGKKRITISSHRSWLRSTEQMIREL
jgi:PAS domain-containing protein